MAKVMWPSAAGALVMVKGCGSARPASGALRQANWPGRQRMVRPLGSSVTVVVSPWRLTRSTVNVRRRRRGAMNSVTIQATSSAMAKPFRSTASDGFAPAGMSRRTGEQGAHDAVAEAPELIGNLEPGERQPPEPAERDQHQQGIEGQFSGIARGLAEAGLAQHVAEVGLDQVVQDHQHERRDAQPFMGAIHAVKAPEQRLRRRGRVARINASLMATKPAAPTAMPMAAAGPWEA
jgi:hypothetical protein